MSLSAPTYTKAGSKSQSPTKLDQAIFGEKKFSAELLKQAYLNYLAKGRQTLATTKNRSAVRGGGRKPWRQKGTGRARHGSIRSPIWRGGGIVFGPSGNENHLTKLSKKARRSALKQSLSIAADENKIKVIDSFSPKDGKTKEAHNLLMKLEAQKRVLIVVENKTATAIRAVSNLQDVEIVQASYLNVFSVVNADTIVFEKSALKAVKDWLIGADNA